jgi:predicted HicB family RNase H-like nuclease
MLEIPKKKTETITTRVSPAKKKKIDTLARQKGLSLYNLASQLMEIGYKEVTGKEL